MPDVSNVTSSASSASGSLGLVSQGTQIAGQIATVIAGLSNQKQQLKAQQAYQALSLQQQNELNERIADASSDNERLQIIVNALVNAKTASSTKAANSWLVPTLIGVGFLAVLVTVILVSHNGKNPSNRNI